MATRVVLEILAKLLMKQQIVDRKSLDRLLERHRASRSRSEL